MSVKKPSILLVDDESYNLMILEECFQEHDYDLTTAEDGQQAWALLQANPHDFDVVLLDWMMPQMDGLEVLKRIKAHTDLQHIYVIMQTARAGKGEVRQGMDAGAYYYLTKPYKEEDIQSIVETAVHDSQHRQAVQRIVEQNVSTFGLVKKGMFEYKTLAECQALSILLANTYPDSEKIATGLSELMINALEHGNLGIGYDEKTQLKKQGAWLSEINRRSALPEYSAKTVSVSYQKDAAAIRLTIEDEGAGFDWQNFLTLNPERAKDNHGRGILTALNSFDKLEYLGTGNKLIVQVQL
ncbi:MAG: hypothetical protein methR_P1562 [Methyloprofundus sp.]|nr:MAG: hypothetical protein methR_P1562 [Methyloprofundus sp.]